MADRRGPAIVALLVALGGCETRGASGLDPDPLVTDEALALLRTLRYDAAPPPGDPSNRVADDPAARALGHRLFFEPALSGPLIDGDNDGSSVTLGVVGEPLRVSCAGCHVPTSSFVDTRSNHQQISLGAQWTARRTPTLLEVAFATLYNWDGRRDSLWSQTLGVLESDREMNSGRLFVAAQMYRLHRSGYESVFGPMPDLDDAARFPVPAPADAGCVMFATLDGPVLECHGKPGDEAEYDGMTPADQELVTEIFVNTGKAIAAYVRALRCGPARFDAWLDQVAGLGANDVPVPATAPVPGTLARDELRGALLFVGRAGCVSCHSGPRMTDDRFHNVGLAPATVAVAFTDTDDRGAAAALPELATDPMRSGGAFSDGLRVVLPTTFGPELEGAFRTPSLRCLEKQPSFMHTGQMLTLEQVVAFFDRGGDRDGYPGHGEIGALDLSERERADLVAFLRALEGAGPAASLLVAPP